jgi:hypothetical protein
MYQQMSDVPAQVSSRPEHARKGVRSGGTLCFPDAGQTQGVSTVAVLLTLSSSFLQQSFLRIS